MISRIEHAGTNRLRVVARLSTSLGGAINIFPFGSPAFSLHRALG